MLIKNLEDSQGMFVGDVFQFVNQVTLETDQDQAWDGAGDIIDDFCVSNLEVAIDGFQDVLIQYRPYYRNEEQLSDNFK